ncbi:hypothetical protein PVAP13_4KG398700 [Panicum virgatum]|uniref:Uncharacterized protein n=1 Tax=Panicum virgatum TaxID=38727 RepID=A0A8T0TNM8_PANVG|nr:hypothetical protein PVAP13_4KG398700 [Panicum virgatum]
MLAMPYQPPNGMDQAVAEREAKCRGEGRGISGHGFDIMSKRKKERATSMRAQAWARLLTATTWSWVDELGDEVAEGEAEEEGEVGADHRGQVHLLLVGVLDGERHDNAGGKHHDDE